MANRILAIGDVHGCFKALMTLLEFVKVSDSDQLIMLGDYVDRGPDSAKVIEFLIGDSKPKRTVCLKGNHELMMKEAWDYATRRRQWEHAGGGATLDSYTREFGCLDIETIPQSHWNFINECRPFHEAQSHIFVHAALYGDLELAEQPDYMLYWEKFDSITPHQSGKTVVCGHSAQRDGIPKNAGHAICIDTYAHGGGWLTCLDAAAGRYYQANQSGETRSDWLDEAN